MSEAGDNSISVKGDQSFSGIKSEARNPKSETISNEENPKRRVYDLEERSLKFAERVISYIETLHKSIANIEVSRQLVRAAGSIGANYIEANESLGKKDFLMRIRISRKESKESRHWLRLSRPPENNSQERGELIQEATELMKIFGSILVKSQ